MSFTRARCAACADGSRSALVSRHAASSCARRRKKGAVGSKHVVQQPGREELFDCVPAQVRDAPRADRLGGRGRPAASAHTVRDVAERSTDCHPGMLWRSALVNTTGIDGGRSGSPCFAIPASVAIRHSRGARDRCEIAWRSFAPGHRAGPSAVMNLQQQDGGEIADQPITCGCNEARWNRLC